MTSRHVPTESELARYREHGSVCTGCSHCRLYLAEHRQAWCGDVLAKGFWNRYFGVALRPMCARCFEAVKRANLEEARRIAEAAAVPYHVPYPGASSSSGSTGQPLIPGPKPPPRPAREMMAVAVGFEQLGNRMDALERRVTTVDMNVMTVSAAVGRVRNMVLENEMRGQLLEGRLRNAIISLAETVDRIQEELQGGGDSDLLNQGGVGVDPMSMIEEVPGETDWDSGAEAGGSVMAVGSTNGSGNVTLGKVVVPESDVDAGGFTVVESPTTPE